MSLYVKKTNLNTSTWYKTKGFYFLKERDDCQNSIIISR